MFVTGCVKFDRVGRALSAQVIVLVAASVLFIDEFRKIVRSTEFFREH